MALKTSLVIAGDGSGAKAALDAVNQGMEQTQGGAQDLTKALDGTETAVVRIGAAQAKTKQSIDATNASVATGAQALDKFDRQLQSTEASLSRTEAGQRSVATAVREASEAAAGGVGALADQQAGFQGLASDLDRIATQLNGGANIGQIIADQGDQMATALETAGGQVSDLGQGIDDSRLRALAMAGAFADADTAITNLANAQAQAKREMDAAKAAYTAGEISLEEYNRELLSGKSALSLYQAEHRAAMKALRDSGDVLDVGTEGLDNQAQGYQRLGFEAQDVATQLMGGANVGDIISSQGPDVAAALEQMGGKFAGLAGILTGPWGAAIFFAVSVIADQLIPALLDSDDAAEGTADAMNKVKLASDGLGAAQSVLGEMFNLTTGKIEKQNEMLLLNARLTALNLRSEALNQRSSAKDVYGFNKNGGLGLSTGNVILGALGVNVSKQFDRSQDVGKLIKDLQTGTIDRDTALQRADKLDYKGLTVTKEAVQQAILDEVSANLKEQTADLIDKSLKDKSLAPGLRKEDTKAKSKPKRDRAEASMAEMGEDTATKIANIRDQFSALPSAVEKSNKAMRALDDIASDIERRRPPNYAQLKPALEEARRAVQDSLLRPFNEYLLKARQAQEVTLLLATGREDEAEALKIALDLQERMGPLSDDQLSSILDTVRAERQRAMVLRDQRALIQANINAVYDMRGALEQTVGDMLKGKFSVKNILASLGDSYVRITSQRIVESMFGDTLRSLEDQASGQQYVEKAGKGIADELKKASDAVLDWRAAVERATIKPGEAYTPGDSISGSGGGDADGGTQESGGENEIVVTAGKGKNGNFVVEMLNQVMRPLGLELPKKLTDLLGSFLNKLEVSLPDVMKGALTGATASKLILGDGGSGVGGAIGGAIGEKVGEKFLSKGLETLAKGLGDFAGPLGSIAGGVIGGVIGGLFKKAKWGTSVVTGQSESDISTSGNKAAYRENSAGVGGTVQDMISQIADQLGGSATGAYNVSIGQYKDNWRVSSTGRTGKLKGKYSDVTDFGKDGAEAAALYAALDAISDGAIKGISAAVEKALKSSDDLQKAVTEALKVQEVELAIGGLGAEIAKAFKDFEIQAKERVRIATQYGFDVVAIEERNAEDRLKLSEQLLKQQVGSLQDLIDEMTSGSLFEGSAVDQRSALLTEISKARDAANAGEDGAADKLAGLLEQLNAVSRDAYGTTGGFADDRNLILDSARDAIAKANQRITDAQKGSDPALATTNATLDEIADQNAKMLSEQINTNGLLSKFFSSGGSLSLAAAMAQTRTS